MVEGITLRNLVSEAFIFPLRSVLIIDDQYPTWEEIFAEKVEDELGEDAKSSVAAVKKWHTSTTAREVMQLIRQFRAHKPGLIIDIHDGVSTNRAERKTGIETPEELADHLHQSDLLILDYNLEGAEVGTGGDTARKILTSVLNNQHFNLVVVHTSEDLDNVIHECLRSLLNSCMSQYNDELREQIFLLEELICIKEESGSFDRSIVEEKLDMETYFEARHPSGGQSKALGEFMRGVGAFAQLSEWAGELELEPAQRKTFFYWSIEQFEKKYIADFSHNPSGLLAWNITESCKWLRTSRGFVCFVKKGPENLMAELETALLDWKPTPSRLISAKFRHEISRLGAEVEETSLLQKHAYAKFYETICNPGNDDLPEEHTDLLRTYRLKNHVARQSEMLSFLVEDAVADYGRKIYQADFNSGFTYHKHYSVDLNLDADKKRAISEYNRHVCCLPSRQNEDGTSAPEQLDSGHIFRLGETWWVCATPACDLQPGQSIIAFNKGGDTSLRPFTAIKLYRSGPSTLTHHHINSGSYCYVEYKGEIIGLGIRPSKDDVSSPAIQKVEWRTFVAEKGGVINNRTLYLLEIQLEFKDSSMKSEQREAEVVAKLRYEYALNYIQRIGASVSRIGLGYVSS
ncbi:response regulator receiver domain [Pantoea ananatis]|uniref:response regulator receiver domain n=1 Tax=Pantoea ananas TaxID=553 RepID=UPI001B306656|nr:response regulator receiver domain [Pantoea ananatis]MDI6539235.1 response regulator receiver domain [Pantoea ananatis]UYL03026.1 response regulator receiver domain [Pantoea ananatis]